jgi:Flp pilus assembly pilin Flp
MSWKTIRRREQGQTMAEYAVVLGVITPGIVFMFGLFGDSIVSGISRVASLIPK